MQWKSAIRLFAIKDATGVAILANTDKTVV